MKKKKNSKMNNIFKIASITGLFVMTYCNFSSAAILGDINNDGKRTREDINLLKNYLIEKQSLTKDQLYAADMNSDWKVTITDLSLLKVEVKEEEENVPGGSTGGDESTDGSGSGDNSGNQGGTGDNSGNQGGSGDSGNNDGSSGDNSGDGSNTGSGDNTGTGSGSGNGNDSTGGNQGGSSTDKPSSGSTEGKNVIGIEVDKLPEKTRYVSGEEFDASGLVIVAVCDDGERVDVTGDCELSGFNSKSIGTQVINVSYNGKITSFKVTVAVRQYYMQGDVVTGIEIDTLPIKTIYKYGEALDLTGLRVVKRWISGNTEAVYNYEVSGYDPYKLGKQKLEVSYVSVDNRGNTHEYTQKLVVEVIDYITEFSVTPNKTVYKYGEDLDIEIVGNFASGDIQDLSFEAIIEGYDSTVLGEQEVTVKYVEILKNGEIIDHEQTITVEVINYVVAFNVIMNKSTYKYGDELDYTAEITYANGETADATTSENLSTNYNNEQLGEQTVEFKYVENLELVEETNELTAEVVVNVIDYITAIEITSPLSKLEYQIGEEINLEGLVVTANYASGATKDVTSDVVLTGFDSSVAGTYEITVTYTENLTAVGEENSFTETFEIVVSETELTGIAISTEPTKKQYLLNVEDIDATGGKLTLTYSDSSTREIDIDSNMISGYDKTRFEEQTVTVTYNGFTTEFNVETYKIEITEPTKKQYIQNYENLDLTGAKLVKTYINGTTEEIDITSDMVTGFDNSSLGTKTVTVNYGPFVGTFNIDIIAKEITGIAVTSEPTKKQYIQNYDALDLTGAKITVTYTDGTTDELDITSEMVTGFDNTTTGTKTITVTYGGQTATFDVVIIEKSLVGIDGITPPTKTEYIQNYEDLDLTGGKITIKYDDESTEEIDITSDMVTGFDNSNLGTKTITVTYGGYTITFDVVIVEKSVVGIDGITPPTKTEYIQNYEDLDLTGGKITVKYNDGTTEEIDITPDMVTGFDNTTLGNKTITVTYDGYTITFDIEIVEKAVSSIELVTEPDKTEYIKNIDTALDLTGATIKVNYEDGTNEIINVTPDMVTGFDNTTLGDQTITITYGGKTVTFEIEVVNRRPVDIQITSMPVQFYYIVNSGEEMDLENGNFHVTFNDGTEEDVPFTDDRVTVLGYDNTTVGEQEIDIYYEEFRIVGMEIYVGAVPTLDKNNIELSVNGNESTVITVLGLENHRADQYGLTATSSAGGINIERVEGQPSFTVTAVNEAEGIITIVLTSVGLEPFELYCNYKTIFNVGVSTIDVSTKPNKTTYIQNYEDLDLTGAKITVTYDDGTITELDITPDMVTGFDNSNLGTKTITVTYGGQTATFDVEIVEKSLVGIDGITPPTKTEYIQNYEDLDLTGGKITIKYDDESTEEIDITPDMVTGFDNTTTGNKTITVTYGGHTITFVITVREKEIIGIDRITPPTKTEYVEGQDLDLTGGKITIKYDDGTTEEIDITESMVSGYNKTQIGTQTITVIYNGYTITFEVEVVEKTVTGIKSLTPPTKTEYIQNYEDLDLTGGKITITYDNGTEETIDITPDMVTGFDNTTTGNKTITVTYGGYTTTFDVVIVEKSLVGIDRITPPTKTEYIQNYEDLDLTGGKITIKYDDESTEEIDITPDMVTGFDNTTTGNKTITVTYGGHTITFVITVREKEIIGIDRITPPTKTEYVEGQDLDLTGGKITIKYDDGTTEEIDITEAMVSGYNKTQKGTQTITVTYGGYTITFVVTVNEKSVIGIDRITPPTKTEYVEGQDLDLTGGKITIKYDNGTTEEIDITESMVSGFDSTTTGTKTVTVRYGEYTITFIVTIVERAVVDGKMISYPTKRNYLLGETLDLSGALMEFTYNDGTTEQKVPTVNMTTGFDSTTIGEKVVVIDHLGLTATFNVYVDSEFGIDKETITLNLDESESTTVRINGVKYSGATKINYTNNNSSVISVNKVDGDFGLFTIDSVGIGETTIVFDVLFDDDTTKTLTCTVTVEGTINVEISKTQMTLDVGESDTVSFSGAPSGTDIKKSIHGNIQVTGSNASYTVTAIDGGNAYIIFTLTYPNGETETFRCDITINAEINMTVTPEELTIDQGETGTIYINGMPSWLNKNIKIDPYDTDYISIDFGEGDAFGEIYVTGVKATTTPIVITITVTLDDTDKYTYNIPVTVEGLIGNLTTDEVLRHNTTYLQSRIDEISANGGGVLTLPAGVYNFAMGGKRSNYAEEYVIKCKDNVSIVGAGTSDTLNTTLIPYGAMTLTSGGRDMFYFNDYGENLGANYLVNADFSDFIIDGGYMTGGSYNTSGKGFMINLCKDCDWDNVVVKNTYATGFGMDCTINCTINNCYAENCGRKAAEAVAAGTLTISEVYGASGFGVGTGYSNDESMIITNSRSVGNAKYGFFFEHQARFKQSFDMYGAQEGSFKVKNCTASGNRYDFGGERAYDLVYSNCIADSDYGLSKSAFHFTEVSVDCWTEGCSTEMFFTDVPTTKYYYEAMRWALYNSIIEGNTNWEATPESSITRSSAVMLLWRYAKRPGDIVYGKTDALKEEQIITGFTDVPGSASYATAVNWAVKEGITTGTTGTEFSPDTECTRGAFITYLYRYAGSPTVTVGNLDTIFTDISTTAYYASALRWAYDNGIVTGVSGGTFSPSDPCVKGAAAVMLYRYNNL